MAITLDIHLNPALPVVSRIQVFHKQNSFSPSFPTAFAGSFVCFFVCIFHCIKVHHPSSFLRLLANITCHNGSSAIIKQVVARTYFPIKDSQKVLMKK